MVYNQSFEIKRLKDLAEQYPSFKQWVDGVLFRIVDLYIPFRDFSYYNSRQQGSASIKSVLPAITGNSYNMEISDGATASVQFYNMIYGDCTSEEKNKKREQLLKYCEMDTLAEVMIVEKLRKLCLG